MLGGHAVKSGGEGESDGQRQEMCEYLCDGKRAVPGKRDGATEGFFEVD
jgi:hypothetical protein